MAKPNEPQDLGRFDEIDERRLDAEVVLLGRFGIVGPRRQHDHGFIVLVEDLDRKLGDAPGHRVELHALSAKIERNRLKLASSIDSRLQPHVYALAEAGRKQVLICEPAVGVAVVSRAAATKELQLEPWQLSTIAIKLAELLNKLHEGGVHGVRFALEQLRLDNSHFSVDGFSHVLGEPDTPPHDVERLKQLLRDIGQLSVDVPSTVTTARELWNHLQSASNEHQVGKFALPVELPFVGRAQALSSLEAGVRQAQIAKPTVVVVQGERGVGKSRLLREFVAAHWKAGNLLILTGAWQSNTADTHSGLLAALEQLSSVLPRLDPDERKDIRERINRATRHLGAILARSAPALGSVLRHPEEELPQLELGGDFSRHTAVIADVLKSIGTRQRPLLLVLDNVESIDTNSAAVLEIIAETQPAHYTLVVLGMRTQAGGYQPQFGREEVDLRPLNIDEVRELLKQSLPGEVEDLPAVAQALMSASQGFPLMLGATLRAWLDRDRLARGQDDIWRVRKSLREAIDVQPSVRDLFSARLAATDASVRQVALYIAILGVEVRDEYLREFRGEVDTAIATLRERGFIVRTDSSVRFPHDTIRELVIDSCTEAERREAHRHAADVLTRRGAPIAQIVYHRDFGFDVENETAEAFETLFRLHVEAGRDRLDVYDLGRARWHLERALEHSHDSEQRGLAAEGLADICLLQEDIDTAVALYTAIIATANPVHAVRVAAKAVQFLNGKNINNEARELGSMALEMANEPNPTTSVGKLWVLFSSLVRSWVGVCKMDSELRDGLCRVYLYMTYIALIDDPAGAPMYVARGRWIAIGLETGAAAIMRSLEGAVATVLGMVKHADEVFTLSKRIANTSKDAWAQGMVFHHWGGALLALARYSDGQDRLDDGIAAFRETGDVSIALMSICFKVIYGRDRERADTILGWIEEGLTTASRNGKRSAVIPMQSLKLQILARQGRSDLDEQLAAQAEATARENVPGIERLLSNIALAYAHLELLDLDAAMPHVKAAQADAEEMGGTVPEFCQEVHLVAALVLVARPMRNRAEQKALSQAVRKFRNALKRAPRLRVLGDLLEMKLALDARKSAKAQHYASKIVSEFDTHENLDAARQAHRALARSLKGENVLAAAQHESLARNLGRRLGLLDHVLLSDFSEIGREVGIIALTEESTINLEESQHELPAAGMLTSSARDRTGDKADPFSSTAQAYDEQSDVLAAWALDGEAPAVRVSLGSIVAPVRTAVSSSIGEQNLEIVCPTPDVQVPVASAPDLQILFINMLLACRDAVGPRIKVSARLEETLITDTDELAQKRLPAPGRYLSVHVSAQGGGTQIPVIGSFATCENDAQALGGVLSASTDRGRVSLQLYVMLDAPLVQEVYQSSVQVLITHPERSVRQTIATALDELGVSWQEFDPHGFGPAELEQASIVFADGATLQDLYILQPLSAVRLVEIIRRGNEPLNPQHDTLRVPFSMTELEARLAGLDATAREGR
jgi:hypothetical protein